MKLNIFSSRPGAVPAYDYDPEKEKPVIRASICTGEQAVGFKDKTTGRFHEVMVIRNRQEIEKFMKAFGLDHIDKEY